MKKKALLLASMGVLACTVGVTALVVGGANQLDEFAVKATPTEYSVTFDESDKTTVKAVDDLYAIGTITAAGSKVGIVGWDNSEAYFTFKGVSFHHLMLSHYEVFGEDEDAYPFSTITGFEISFSSEEGEEPMPISVDFSSMETMIHHVESGTPYKGLSITPDDDPHLLALGESIVTITSLTIWYSC